MSKTSLTEAGQTNPQNANRDDLIEAVNQIFSLFRLNFHNQYYKAYADDKVLLNQAKKLWFESLKTYSAQTVLSATKKIIEEQEFLPTLHQMLSQCAQTDSEAPSAHQAYVEACNAPSPKAKHAWSHPAVYEAGRKSDWFFLSTTPEQFAYPVFKNHYEELLKQIAKGVELAPPMLEDNSSSKADDAVSKPEGLANIQQLKQSLGF